MNEENPPEAWADLTDDQREALLNLATQDNQRVTRRDVLAGGAGLLGLGGLLKGAGTARAASSGGTISNLGGINGPITGGTELTDLTGNNLSIDSNGSLNAAGGSSSDTIHLFAVGGQSNANGKGDETASPDVSSDVAVEYSPANDAIESPLDDPVGDGESDGSAWPAFAQKYYSLTGVKSAIVVSAVDGSAQDAGADAGSGNWDDTGNLRGQLVTDVNNAISKLESAGYDVVFHGILWSQGERDAQAIDNGDITQSDYKTAFEGMVDYFDGEFGDSWNLHLLETGRPNTGDTAGFRDVREAQRQVANSKERVILSSTIQQTFPPRGWHTDDLHYNQTGLDNMGRQAAQSILEGYEPPNRDYEAIAWQSSDLSTTSGTAEIVPYDSEQVDDIGVYDPTTYKYSAPADGYYRVETSIMWDTTAPSDMPYRYSIWTDDSGTTAQREARWHIAGPTGDYRSQDLYGLINVNAGEDIYVQVKQSTGNSQTLTGFVKFARLKIAKVQDRDIAER